MVIGWMGICLRLRDQDCVGKAVRVLREYPTLCGKAVKDGAPGFLWGLVAALVHAGDAVMPAEAFVVEAGPEEADADGAGGQDGGEDAAAHLGAGGVFVGQGAEADTGVAHTEGGFGEGEEEEMVGKGKEEDGRD